MVLKIDPRWICDHGTRAKLAILRGYLGAWFNILAASGFRHAIYFDGFCGPGQYVGGEDGSPVVATRVANSVAAKFPHFQAHIVCVDQSATTLEFLAQLPDMKKRHPQVSTDIRHGTFEGSIGEIFSNHRYPRDWPTFSFVDPFGFGGLSFASLGLLMRNESSEIFVNLMCGFMNRFKDHPDVEVRQKIERMIGVDNLDRVLDAPDGISELCNVYHENLLKLGRHVLRFMMRDEKNVRDNALFFCGRNKRGFEKIKEAMWRIDPIYGAGFSEFSTQRDTLFQSLPGLDRPQTTSLRTQLIEKFKGRRDVPMSQLIAYTVEETETFLPKHLRMELEHLLGTQQINFVDPHPGARKRRKGGWPERLLISFRI